jgi:BirA family biotin operon repressor/biotin-[acetyl-CoA-carboxylase] ligase
VWAAWRDGSATLGREVRLETADGTITGLAEDITDCGRLVLRRDDRVRVEIDAGDVVHLRPAQ